jgi:hypothetical protein
MLPKKPPLRVTTTQLGKGGVYRIKVTASVAGVGANESAVDTRPVRSATVTLEGRQTSTNDRGLAMVKVRGEPRTPHRDRGRQHARTDLHPSRWPMTERRPEAGERETR